MKLLCISALVFGHLAAQINSQLNFLQKLSGLRYKISQEENSVVIEGSGIKQCKLLEYDEHISFLKSSIDSTGIDIHILDTSLYSNKYKFWQEIPVCLGLNWTPIIGDVNCNNQPEVYGNEADYTTPRPAPVVIYEMDLTQKFKRVYKYADTIHAPQTLIDLDNDGNREIVMFGLPRGMIFKKDSPTSFPTTFQTKFGLFGSQTNDPTVGDFDKNGKTDVVYWSNLKILIEEFDASKNSFDSIYGYYPAQNGLGGFSIGDFDEDGKTDIVFGTVNGDVVIIEAQGEYQYQVVWTSKVETYNAYLHFWTNDIDGNGKKEFWVGGDAFYNGLGITRFTCFEPNDNNSYIPVARLDIIGIFSFFAGNCSAKDIDGDGIEELLVCLDQHVLIFKFSGGPNTHQYSLLFAKRNEMANQNSVYYNATLYDFTKDGKNELLIGMDQVIDGIGQRVFSRIYTLDIVTEVKLEQPLLPSTTELYQNYPNPFNPTTTIRFHIASNNNENVIIKVYNILGKEIRELLNKNLRNGEYGVVWDGKDNTNMVVESGVYFITMRASAYQKTIKTVFLK